MLLHTASLSPQKGIVKLKRLLEGDEEEQFKPDQYMTLYTCVRVLQAYLGIAVM